MTEERKQNQTALQTRTTAYDQQLIPGMHLVSVSRSKDVAAGVEIISAVMDAAPFSYSLSGSKQKSLTAAGYSIVNSVVGVNFGKGRLLNHTPDSIVAELTGWHVNASGQPVEDYDLVELSFAALQEHMRATHTWETWESPRAGEKAVKVLHKAEVTVTYDAAGRPQFRIQMPPEQEIIIYKNLLNMWQSGTRKILTILKKRLISQACGIKKLPDFQDGQRCPLAIIGYRRLDGISAAQAAASMGALYGVRETTLDMGEICADMTQGTEGDGDIQEVTNAKVTQESPAAAGESAPAEETTQAAATETTAPAAATATGQASTQQPAAAGGEDRLCHDCQQEIRSDKVLNYSREKFGVPVCYDCQEKRKGGSGGRINR